MSAAGFLSQALLGGTQQAAQGVGNQLREEARLKRQQALDATRSQNTMAEQTQASALRIGEDNLNREHASAEADKSREYGTKENERNREHALSIEELRAQRQRELVDYRFSKELEIKRQEAELGGKITEQQSEYLKRINADINHLHQMERELTSGRTGEFGEIGVVTPDNSAEKLQELRQRLKAKEIAFNGVIGSTSPTDPMLPILNQAAAITDPADQQEFLADLKESRVYSDTLASSVQDVWGAKSEPAAAPEPAPQPAPGMITQAQDEPAATAAPAAEPQPEPQAEAEPQPKPAPEPAPAPVAQPEPDPEDWREQKLGPKIEQAAKTVMSARDQAIARRANASVAEMEKLAISGKPLSPQQKVAFLQQHGKHLKDAPPEVQEQMIEIFGRNMLTPYLK